MVLSQVPIGVSVADEENGSNVLEALLLPSPAKRSTLDVIWLFCWFPVPEVSRLGSVNAGCK